MARVKALSVLGTVFTGQGSQSVGMGQELYETYRAARRVFQQADDILDFPLSQLMFEGPDSELRDTVNAQPAIMAVSIACWRAWEEFLGSDAPVPASIAGHSLGEYTALVVSGVLSFPEAVLLVRERGRLMRQAGLARPGGMAAILGLDEGAVWQICEETGAELANVNSDDQMVISGDRVAVACAMELSNERGATKVIPLPVSGAFHSSLMLEAQEGLEKAMASLRFRNPQIPIIANSTGLPLATAQEVREELACGMCSCVRWRDSIRYMVRHSRVSDFVEFGPARVLSGLIRRIDRGVQAASVSDASSLQKAVETVRQKLWSTPRRRAFTLGTVAGVAVVAEEVIRRTRQRRRRARE